MKDEESGRPLLRGTVKDGIYLISQAVQPEVNIRKRTSLNNWHHRLGHPNMKILQSIVSIYGLPTFPNNRILICDACLSSKSHRLPYSKSSHQTTKPLEIVHSDLWGPSPVVSYTGNKYYVIFVDDFTKYSWLYPLKLKSDVFQVFVDFQHRVERQLGQKIISFQSDFGGEFQALSKYFIEQGISHRISCPHTLAQNGTAERKHRHIIETALSLMRHSSVPNKFWDEAVCTAAYLINRLVTPNLKNKSPYHLIYSQEPDYHMLKSFGCACYPCLRPYTSSKLDSRSELCLFLGYSAFHYGYRCLSLSSGKMYISRDVAFMESIFPYKEPLNTDTSAAQLPIGLLGSSPVHTHHTLSLVISTSSHTPEHLPTSLKSHITSPTVTSPEPHVNSPNTTSPNTHSSPHYHLPIKTSLESLTTGHIPSQNPLSPSNLDSCNDKSLIKTRRLADIFKTLDSVYSTHKSKFPLPNCLHVSSLVPSEPTHFASAIKQSEWLDAMKNEFQALIENKTWNLVPRPLNRPVIGCKWIYKVKPSADKTHKYKARLVAQGFLQEGGIDYHQTFSPVIKVTTIRILLALAVSQSWHIQQLDISNAFLHGDLQEIIYTDQPPGFEDTQYPHHVCKLRKSLYGLKQAPREWFQKLTSQLQQLGFQGSKTDTSLYFSHTGPVYILIYVDDILIMGPSLSQIRHLISSLSTHFKLKDLGPADNMQS